MSRGDSHPQPSRRAAPHWNRAAGQAGGFQPAYHGDNAVFCDSTGQQTSLAKGQHAAVFLQSEYYLVQTCVAQQENMEEARDQDQAMG